MKRYIVYIIIGVLILIIAVALGMSTTSDIPDVGNTGAAYPAVKESADQLAQAPLQLACRSQFFEAKGGRAALWSAEVANYSGNVMYFWTGAAEVPGSTRVVTKLLSDLKGDTELRANVAIQTADGQRAVAECPTLSTVGGTAVTPPVTLSCTATPTTAHVSQLVTWTATATGGNGPGSYLFIWSGEGLGGSGPTKSVRYNSVGAKSPVVRVASGQSSASMQCPSVTITAAPVAQLSGTCTVTPGTEVGVNDPVTYTVKATGNTSPVSYAWTGSNNLSGDRDTVTKNFPDTGVKTAQVRVTAGSDSTTVTCSQVNVVQRNGAPVAQSATAPLYTDAARDTYTQRIINYVGVGNQAHDSRRHVLHEDVPTPPGFNYWFDRFNDNTVTLRQAGYERMLIWFPIGWKHDELSSDWLLPDIFPFKVWDNAKQQTPWVTERFVEYWKPIVESGVEVIAYIGNPLKDKKMKLYEHNEALWFSEAHKEVKPFTDAGMTIAFDYINGGEINSLSWRFVEQLQAKGTRVIAENPPESWSAGHWGKIPFLTFEWPHPRPQVMTNPDGEIIGVRTSGAGMVDQAKQWLTNGISTAISTPLWNGSVSQSDIRQFLPPLPNRVTYIAPKATDPENNPVTFRIATQPTRGTVTIHPRDPKLFVYTANASFTSGADSFTFVANDGVTDSAPATITIEAAGEMPLVTAQQMVQAAKQVGGGNNPIVAVWPLRQKDIQELNIDDNVPANFTAKRVITFKIGGQPRSYVAGYETSSRTPKAYPATFAPGQLLITGNIGPSNATQPAGQDTSLLAAVATQMEALHLFLTASVEVAWRLITAPFRF
jgi:hypothetical protein